MHDDTILRGSGLSEDTAATCVREGSLHSCKDDIDKLIAVSVVRSR